MVLEKTLESPLDCKEIQLVRCEEDRGTAGRKLKLKVKPVTVAQECPTLCDPMD